MVTALCGVRFRRRSSEPCRGKNVKTSEPAKLVMSSMAKQGESELDDSSNEHLKPVQVELPLPPSKQLKPTRSCNRNLMTRSVSTRNLISTMSMKLPKSFSMSRSNNQKEEQCNNKKKKGKFKPEDSVWMKTIILGEKCRVPDEDEVTIYDGKGKRISTYHPKTTISFPVSRQNSQIDISAIPSQDGISKQQQLRSPFSRQCSQIGPDAVQGGGKAVKKNEIEFS